VPLTLNALKDIPLIHEGDDLISIIAASLDGMGIQVADGDVIVIAQKIVSKAEGRLVNLSTVEPSTQAREIALLTEKDSRFVEMVLRESRSVLRTRPGALIVEHRLGFVCANAGIDHSNVEGPWGDPEDWILLLPSDPDGTAQHIRAGLKEIAGADVGVVIIDSHGRAWRMGTVGVAIGVAGVPALVDLRGNEDLFRYKLRITQVAAADELAAAASLIMGQAAEATPVVHVRGFPYTLREASLTEVIRPLENDLFR